MRRIIELALLLVLLALCASACASTPPLRPAVETHLQAVRTRNLDALLPTITGGSDLRMIAPNGVLSTTRAQYVDFHRQWFETNDNGRFEPEIVHLVQSPRLGHVLIKLRYRATAPTGATQDTVSWLALTFALEDGSWRLVFDQSTLIQPGS
jgi:ketosteroid isomerase-like protein